ncbi:MAG: hypothetical protein IPN90_00145 [Elusimicrobia bacterium]|nr:hypothetical protein [Elusimicrobiota bacterium]
MKPHRVERVVLVGAAALYLWNLVLRPGPIPWGTSAVYIPTGLITLSLTNTFLRAKGLAWGIFTVTLVVFMIVVGTWVVMDRAMKGPPPADFARSLFLYGSLAAAGLIQLRVSSSSKGDSSP